MKPSATKVEIDLISSMETVFACSENFEKAASKLAKGSAAG